MCGICGAVWTDPSRALRPEHLRRMTQVLAHRGPDDEGYYQDRSAALGFRRLSIIDLAGGHQPLSNEDDTVWIIFNGEIYNFHDLRRRLEGTGHTFKTHTDTETVLHLYEDEGPECVQRLRGMFAFAVWDTREERLMLARDRLGVKPLVYRWESDRLLFASELKSILQAPGVPRRLEPTALDHYLTYQYVPHPWTIFAGIHKLPPAHYALYQLESRAGPSSAPAHTPRDGRLTLHQYWQPDFSHEDPLDEAEYSRRLRETLTEATRLRMIADVPLGAFLSGGVDSTITVGLMQQSASEPVKTFSIGFPVAQFDETAFARRAAEHLGTDHHEFVVEPNCLEVLPQLVWHYDEPFADSSAIPTYYLSQITRQHVTVALTGDAGDELFAGYPRYKAVRLGERFDRLPRPVRRILTSRLWQKLPASVRQKSRVRRLKKLLRFLGDPPEHRYLSWISIFDEPARAQLYTDDFVAALAASNGTPEEHDPAHFLLAAYARCRGRDFLTRTTFVDLLSYLPCDLLTKVDIASMAHGLECRSPFLDHHVVELCGRMPIDLKLRRGRAKYLLKKTFADLLPREIRRRGKMGFGVPLDHWFRGEMASFVQETLLDSKTLARGYFRPDAVRQLVDQHLAGVFDHSSRLWALVFFELWHRKFLDPADPPTGP